MGKEPVFKKYSDLDSLAGGGAKKRRKLFKKTPKSSRGSTRPLEMRRIAIDTNIYTSFKVNDPGVVEALGECDSMLWT